MTERGGAAGSAVGSAPTGRGVPAAGRKGGLAALSAGATVIAAAVETGTGTESEKKTEERINQPETKVRLKENAESCMALQFCG